MYENSYKLLAETMRTTLASIVTSYTESSKLAFSALTTQITELCNIIMPIYSSEHFMDLASQMSELCKNMLSILNNPTMPDNAFDFLNNINLQDEYIELTEDNSNSINTFLESSNAANDAPEKIQKGKIAVPDFIKSVLIPVLSILLPMLLNLYYHKVNSIESQKQYIAELQLQEEELHLKEAELLIKEQQLQNDIKKKEILENILIEFQNQSEYYKSLLSESGCPCSTPELPCEAPEPFDEAPESPDEVPDYFGVAADESGNQ